MEGAAEIHVYCGATRTTITVGGTTYRASGGKCFSTFDHKGNPNAWVLMVGKQTMNANQTGPEPRHPFLHVTSTLRRPGTYKPPRDPVIVSLQIRGLGTELANQVKKFPAGLGTVRETASVMPTAFTGIGPIPQRGTFTARQLLSVDPQTALATGKLPPLTGISGSWHC